MLGADYKLVGVAGMFEVVDQTRGDHCQLVVLLEVLLDVANLEHVVETLEGIQDVHLVVEWVLFEVTLRDFTDKTNQVLGLNVREFK